MVPDIHVGRYLPKVTLPLLLFNVSYLNYHFILNLLLLIFQECGSSDMVRHYR